MYRYAARNSRHAVLLTTRRLALTTLVITAAGISAAQPSNARVAAHHAVLEAHHHPRPGGGGGQVIRGGRAGGGQGRSGMGRFNQSVTGTVAPTFVQGASQQAFTNEGSFDVQNGVCWRQPTICTVGQNLPVRYRS
ncbi:hypothetical protein Misp03_85130 [Microbispora sp. NBRC 16548]|nr:hypothetical protein Misp03_85130 [Microbispora sp. NBRC 16548]